MIIRKCDNTEYFKWIKMSEPIFEDMNIDTSKIEFYMDKECNIYLPDASGRASEKLDSDYTNFRGITVIENGFFIQIRNDLLFDSFITTCAHEVGHVTQKWGYSGSKNCLKQVKVESIALKFEKKFIKKFNKKHGTDIAVNTDFKLCKNIIANYFKIFAILITKSEYKLKK